MVLSCPPTLIEWDPATTPNARSCVAVAPSPRFELSHSGQAGRIRDRHARKGKAIPDPKGLRRVTL